MTEAADPVTSASLDRLPHEPWERVLPFVGVILALVIVVEVAATWVLDDLLGPVVLQVVLTELFPGREAAIPIGLTGHIDEWWLWQITWTVDMAYFCFLYPLFLTVMHRRHGKGGFFMRRIEKLQAAAEKRKAFAKKWGPIGVFLFMMVPFLVNGPLVGMVVGRLAGIRTRRLFLPVISANLISNGVWVILYDEFFWQMRRVSEDLDRIVAFSVYGVLLTAAAIAIIVDEVKERRKRRRTRVRL